MPLSYIKRNKIKHHSKKEIKNNIFFTEVFRNPFSFTMGHSWDWQATDFAYVRNVAKGVIDPDFPSTLNVRKDTANVCTPSARVYVFEWHSFVSPSFPVPFVSMPLWSFSLPSAFNLSWCIFCIFAWCQNSLWKRKGPTKNLMITLFELLSAYL